MYYQYGVDAINEIAFEKEIADKRGIKSKIVDAEFTKKLTKNKQSAINYAISELSKLINPELSQLSIQSEGKVIVEGKIDFWSVDSNGFHIGTDNLYSFANKVMKYDGKKVKLILKECDDNE